MNRPSSCNHEDWPACGCGEEPSQEQQHEQFTELNGALDGLDAFEHDDDFQEFEGEERRHEARIGGDEDDMLDQMMEDRLSGGGMDPADFE